MFSMQSLLNPLLYKSLWIIRNYFLEHPLITLWPIPNLMFGTTFVPWNTEIALSAYVPFRSLMALFAPLNSRALSPLTSEVIFVYEHLPDIKLQRQVSPFFFCILYSHSTWLSITSALRWKASELHQISPTRKFSLQHIQLFKSRNVSLSCRPNALVWVHRVRRQNRRSFPTVGARANRAALAFLAVGNTSAVDWRTWNGELSGIGSRTCRKWSPKRRVPLSSRSRSRRPTSITSPSNTTHTTNLSLQLSSCTVCFILEICHKFRRYWRRAILHRTGFY